MNRLEQLRAKRLELIKNIAAAADQIAALDCEIEAIQMNLRGSQEKAQDFSPGMNPYTPRKPYILSMCITS